MSAEHDRLLAVVAPLRAAGWVFVPTSLAAPTEGGTVDALFGLHTHGDLEDNVQVWEKWAVASRLRKTRNCETPTWHSFGRADDIVRELLELQPE
ncbi:MAG: hypothetical protein WBA97_02290 [Actinophytocola sp.]|uniref:hypothetical protein n=1 Tax=Actinophytocola sp. TaxID=1872138 RepID=UPI003C721B4A